MQISKVMPIKAGDILTNVLALAFLGAIGLLCWKIAQAEVIKIQQREEVLTEFSKTATGKFAVNSYHDCMAVGITDRSPTGCVNEVVTAARNLKGTRYAESVGHDLAGYLDALRAIDNQ